MGISIDEMKALVAQRLNRPEWAKGCTPTQARQVAAGRHPMGLPLLEPADAEKRCGTCCHLKRKDFSKTYLKCDLAKDTGGPATDVRVKWPACQRWGAQEGKAR